MTKAVIEKEMKEGLSRLDDERNLRDLTDEEYD